MTKMLKRNSKIQGDTRNNDAYHNNKFKKKVNMKELQCYCFHEFDHYV